jgi:hypothetical protein
MDRVLLLRANLTGARRTGLELGRASITRRQVDEGLVLHAPLRVRPRRELGETESTKPSLFALFKLLSSGFAESVFRSASRYHSWVDPATGPTGHEPHIYGLYPTSGTTAEAFGQALSELAFPFLEETSGHLRNATQALAPVLAEALRYYDEGQHGDDRFAHGQALHAPLEAAFSAFDKSFTDLADRLERGVHPADARAVQSSPEARWLGLAQAVFWEAVGPLHALNLEALLAAVEGLEATLRAASGPLVPSGIAFARASRRFARASKNPQEPSAADKALIAAGQATQVAWHPASVAHAYRVLIEASNRTR